MPRVPLSENADTHVFISGGIGITAFIASAQHYQRIGYNGYLRYLVRDTANVAF